MWSTLSSHLTHRSQPHSTDSPTLMARGRGGATGAQQPKRGKEGGHNDDVRRETPLQAILFADSFNETFRPITLSMPKVLLPLAHVPMLEYALEFLVANGVQEVVLFCTHHAEQVEAFVATQSQVAKRVKVTCVTSPSCITAGDALREIDRQQLIQSNPFVLMSGDVVANVDLRAAVEEHHARKKKDPSCMMTSIFKEIQPTVGTDIRPLNDELLVGMDSTTSQIVLYENDPLKRSTRLATIFLEEHAQISLRSDLMDCYIDICSPEVLLKFAEDFDYQDLRQDFFHNEVQNYELGKKFFVKIVTDEFAARVMDPRTYSGISRAILQRWVFPMVPDTNYLGPEASNYTYHRGMIYKDDNVTLARTCSIQRESILGAGSSFGEHTTVVKSSVGRGCQIGARVTIEGSFIWSNVVVEDDVTISNAILCDNVVIRKGAVIGEGCVLSFGVAIGAGFKLPPYSKVTTAHAIEEEDGFSSSDDEDEEAKGTTQAVASADATTTSETEWKASDVGVGGVGRLWTLDDDDIQADDDDEEEEEDEESKPSVHARRLDRLKSYLIGGEDVVVKKTQKWDEWETLSSSDEEDDGLDDELEQQMLEVPFHQIIREMVTTGDAAGHGVDDLFLEIKSFKFAQNRSFADVIGAILPGLLDLIPTTDPSAMAILGQVRTKFQKWSTVIKKCLVERSDQFVVVTELESYCQLEARHALWTPLFRYLLQIVYDLEWVQDDVILSWYADAPTENSLAQSAKEFIEWLQESEDEDDEESDEDSDDD